MDLLIKTAHEPKFLEPVRQACDKTGSSYISELEFKGVYRKPRIAYLLGIAAR